MANSNSISSHASVAKTIRSKLKQHGIDCRVTSKSYSGGNSVTVHVQNVPPWTMKEVKSFCDQFEMGHFDGMVDLYEYSNRRDDIPQVKFVFVENGFSDDIHQAAYEYLCRTMHAYRDYPATFTEAQNLPGSSGRGSYVSQEVWQVLNGSFDEFDSGTLPRFWIKPRVKLAGAA